MDDFLYNLRRETDKRNRKQSGQQQYRGEDRRGPRDQRRPYQKRYESTDQPSEIKTLLGTLSENQKQFLANDNRKIQALEAIATALQSLLGGGLPTEIKKVAVESTTPEVTKTEAPKASVDAPKASVDAPKASADSKHNVKAQRKGRASVGASKASADPVEAPRKDAPSVKVKVDADKPSEKPLRSTHEEIRKIALSLREQGKTYKEIALYLDEEKIPTFSGKGGWHAPTIHKLCK